MFLMFQALAFAVPPMIFENAKNNGTFWVCYIIIDLSFVLLLAASRKAFTADTKQKRFYSLSLISVSYIGLILMVLFGGTALLLPAIPDWIGSILCVATLCLTGISVIKADAAAQIISQKDADIKEKTSFMKSLAVNASALVSAAETNELKGICQKISEAIRYADPMSNAKLSDIENNIQDEVQNMKNYVIAQDIDNAKTTAVKIENLIKERNQKCKLWK